MNRDQERDDREVEDLVARLRAVTLVQPRPLLRARVLASAPPPLRQVLGWVAVLAASIILSCILIPPFRAETPMQIQVGQFVLKGPVTTSPWNAFRSRYQNSERGC